MKTEMKRMKKIGISTAAVMLLLCVAAVMPVSAGGTLWGYGYDAESNPANLNSVDITGETWGPLSASISSGYYYQVSAPDATNGETLTYDFVCANGYIGIETATYDGSAWFQHDLTCAGEAKPDLTITEKSEEMANSTHFNVTYTVKNAGTGNATNVSTTTISTDGNPVANESCSALNIGENETKTVGPFPCSCGTTVTVNVCADTTGNVTEINENNNCLENVYACPACPPTPGVEVNKTVLDSEAGEWTKEVVAANGSSLTFNISVHAVACNLTNLTVTDIYSESLNYTDASIEPDHVNYTTRTLIWNVSALDASETQNIIVNMSKIATCDNNNTVSVTAWNNDTTPITLVSDDSIADVTGYEQFPRRTLPEVVMHGTCFNVTVEFTPCVDINSVGLHDVANETPFMNVSVVDVNWCDPAASSALKPDDNTAEYSWYTTITALTPVTANYTVCVDDTTPDGNYTFDGQLTYYVGAVKHVEDVVGDTELEVISGIAVTGNVREASCPAGNVSGVDVALIINGTTTVVDTTVTDASGDYTLAAQETGDYDVNVIGCPLGYRNQSKLLTIATMIPAPNPVDFHADNSLTPENPNPSQDYLLQCVNQWISSESYSDECKLTQDKALDVSNAYLGNNHCYT